MKVILPKITYPKYSEVIKESTQCIDTLQSLKELTIHDIKRLPFAAIYMQYAYFIINKCTVPVFMYIFTLMLNTFDISKTTGRYIAAGILSFSFAGSIIGIALIFALKILFSLANKVFPRKTPMYDKEQNMKRFIKETKEIENTLYIANEISKLNDNDINYSEIITEDKSNIITLFLKDSQYGLTTKYTLSISNEDIMNTLRKSGILNLSLIDKEWDALLEKYEIT